MHIFCISRCDNLLWLCEFHIILAAYVCIFNFDISCFVNTPTTRTVELERLRVTFFLEQTIDVQTPFHLLSISVTGEEESSLLPCLVYVHGESYEWNSGNPYDGTILASTGRVIVVTINFRLGVLGKLAIINVFFCYERIQIDHSCVFFVVNLVVSIRLM